MVLVSVRASRRVPVLVAVLVVLLGLASPATARTTTSAEQARGEAAAVTPVVTGIAADGSPVAGGRIVTLRGAGFNGVYVVAFGSVRTRNLHVWSSTEITVRVPRHGPGILDVRVARAGRASTATSLSKFQYYRTEVPPRLQAQGPATVAPPVSTVSSRTVAALSCPEETFCGAVGDRGLSTYRDGAWTAVTPTGTGSEPVAIDCSDETACMAYGVDGHTWRFNRTTWTDLGSIPGLRSLSCASRSCVATAGRLVHVYRNGGRWSAGLDVVPGGASAASCTENGCVVTSRGTDRFRIYSMVTDTWAPVRTMYASSGLRHSSLTRAVVGELQCTGRERCVSAGQPDPRTGVQQVAYFTGRAWSIGYAHATSVKQPRRGTVSLRDCSYWYCVVLVDGRTSAGAPYRDWFLLDRDVAASPSGLRGFDAVSCYDSIACWGLRRGTFQRVGPAPR